MCKFEDSITIVPDGTTVKCIYKITQDLKCCDCKYKNSTPISMNTLFLAISTECNVGKNECTFCDCKFSKKRYKFNKEAFIESILANIKNEDTFLVFGLFESLVKVDDLMEVLRDSRISSINNIVVETNGKVFNKELCLLLNKLDIQLTINHHVADKEVLKKYIENINKLKVEITFTKKHIEESIDIKGDFNRADIIKFRFVNAINGDDRTKIVLNNMELMNHESLKIRESYREFFKRIYSQKYAQ